MIITTEQLEYLKKIVSDMALEFGEQKQAVKDYWQALPDDNKDSLQRGIFLGKSSAYDFCYQRVVSLREKFIGMKIHTIDEKFHKLSETLRLQALVLTDLAQNLPEEQKEKLLDQIALLNNVSKELRLLFRNQG